MAIPEARRPLGVVQPVSPMYATYVKEVCRGKG